MKEEAAIAILFQHYGSVGSRYNSAVSGHRYADRFAAGADIADFQVDLLRTSEPIQNGLPVLLQRAAYDLFGNVFI